MLPGAEILINKPMSSRGERFLRTISHAAPAGSKITSAYEGKHQLLVVYGPGMEYRTQVMQKHKAAGGRVIGFDMGYWDREDSMRLFVDEVHPTPEQLDSTPLYSRRGFSLRDDHDPNGPIMLVGLGQKSVKSLGYGGQSWEMKALQFLREAYPGRRIVWRPKGPNPTPLENLPVVFGSKIEDALKGCSLVYCRHSNVAVDACVAGIPVICEGGAAYYLYRNGPNPEPDRRRDFLSKLSWWEWHRTQGKELWQWIRSICA